MFSSVLIKWYRGNKRDLPWRRTTDPYKIWLSEVILQQTRVEQGLDYYNRFVEEFPTVKHLANASEDKVLKLWQGLGYYSRARNLHHTAKLVMEKYKGVFPSTYNELVLLKGIGNYTASAISSFCSNEAKAVVDGNVYRVLSRIFGIATPIDSTIGKKEFALLAEELLSKKDPATHNQAVMEFGALQCKPKNPDCAVCPLQHKCAAVAVNKIAELPVKAKKTKVSKRYFEYFVFRYKDHLYIKKRTGDDIWKNLYDFPMLESDTALKEEKVLNHALLLSYIDKRKYVLLEAGPVYKHVLSHQHIYARFWQFKFKQQPSAQKEWKKIPLSTVNAYAWPRLIDKFLNNQLRSGQV
ncbi:MAG: A/G-specific adenine glycosylase [Bacteroidia bacterium]